MECFLCKQPINLSSLFFTDTQGRPHHGFCPITEAPKKLPCSRCSTPIDPAVDSYQMHFGRGVPDKFNHTSCPRTYPNQFCSICRRPADHSDSEVTTNPSGFFVYKHRSCLAEKERKKDMADLTNVLTNIEFQSKLMNSRVILETGKDFFTLWNPDSDKPPRIVYTTEEEAWKVADILAKRNVGKKFYVLKSVGHAVTSQPVVHIKTSPTPPLLRGKRAPKKSAVTGSKRKAVS